MRDINIFEINDFINSDFYSNYSQHIKSLILELVNEVSNAGLEFVIKVRKDNTLALALKEKKQKNIGTIWVYEKHLRLVILNEYDKKIFTVDDVTEDLISALKDKHYSQSLPKKQVSIYLDETLLNKIEIKAKEENKKFNDIIVEALQEKVSDVFINSKHKLDFSKLIKSAGLYSEDKSYINTTEKQKKIIAFFYLVSAYQDDFYKRCGDRFSYDGENKILKGPTFLISELETGVADYETMLGLGWCLLKGKESRFELTDFLWDLDNNRKFHLAVNAFKIVGGQIGLFKDDLVSSKAVSKEEFVDIRLDF